VTSAAYGYSVGRGVTYAWVAPEYAEPGTSVQIEYFGERLTGTVRPDAVFDPHMERMRVRAVAAR
jgi:glycine cleavage system aminomethyltransferase T